MAKGENNKYVFFHKKAYAPRLMPYACFYLTNPDSRQTVFRSALRENKKGGPFGPPRITVSAVKNSYFTKGAGIG